MSFRPLWVPLLAAATLACSHALEIRNFHDYARPAQYVRVDPPLRVGILPFSGAPDDLFYFNTLVERLARSPAVENLRTDWGGDRSGRFDPDIVLSIQPSVTYRSSGWNFVKNFPGFLVWAPAAAGYTYYADIETRVMIHAAGGELLGEKQIPVTYDIRQADFDRAAVAELSWFEAGLLAFGGGIYNANNFDRDIIGPLQVQIQEGYANYVLTETQPLLRQIADGLDLQREPPSPVSAEGAAPLPEDPPSQLVGDATGTSSGGASRREACEQARRASRAGAKDRCREQDSRLLSFEHGECRCDKPSVNDWRCQSHGRFACTRVRP